MIFPAKKEQPPGEKISKIKKQLTLATKRINEDPKKYEKEYKRIGVKGTLVWNMVAVRKIEV